MRTQGEARFTGQWQAKVGAASMVQDAIAKEKEDKPKFNVIGLALFVGACEVCLVVGFALGYWGAK